MSKASRHPPELGQPRSSASMLDKYAIVPISACVFALIASPLSFYFLHLPHTATTMGTDYMGTDYETRIFWPAIAAISVIFAMRNHSRLGRLAWPPHILCLFACLAFAGASVLWA